MLEYTAVSSHRQESASLNALYWTSLPRKETPRWKNSKWLKYYYWSLVGKMLPFCGGSTKAPTLLRYDERGLWDFVACSLGIISVWQRFWCNQYNNLDHTLLGCIKLIAVRMVKNVAHFSFKNKICDWISTIFPQQWLLITTGRKYKMVLLKPMKRSWPFMPQYQITNSPFLLPYISYRSRQAVNMKETLYFNEVNLNSPAFQQELCRRLSVVPLFHLGSQKTAEQNNAVFLYDLQLGVMPSWFRTFKVLTL